MIASKKETKSDTTKKVSKIESLPSEILERCLSFLDARDLCMNVEPLCKSFREVSKVSRVWKEIARRKYGDEVVAEAISKDVYSFYKDMVADDMKLVATQAISMTEYPASANWRYNSDRMFYVCLVLGIQYHRPTDEVRIYLEARGERDLRNPRTSSILREFDNLSTDAGAKPLTSKGFQGISYGRGHYRGYVSFEASYFERPGVYIFSFADPRISFGWGCDYEPIHITKIRPGKESLLGTFTNTNKNSCKSLYVLENWSPLVVNGDDDDSGETAELERFRPFVDYPVWNRHNNANANYRQWWVGKNSGSSQSLNGESNAYADFMDSLVLFDLARNPLKKQRN